MALSEDQRRLYARHLLLAEIGDAEQGALCEAALGFAPGTSAGVRRVAAEYLQRAGVTVVNEEVREGAGASEAQVQSLAGDGSLAAPAEALAGAFEAVEAIKAITGVGTKGALDPALRLGREES